MIEDPRDLRTRTARPQRVLVFDVQPAIDGGRYAVKRVEGDDLDVSCDLVCDGHERVAGVLRVLEPGAASWAELPLSPRGNDRWGASVALDRVGRWKFQVEAWPDEFSTWRHFLRQKVEARQDVGVELRQGAVLVQAAADRAQGDARSALRRAGHELDGADRANRVELALSETIQSLMAANPDRSGATRDGEYDVVVDPLRARFSSWYELFPRSFGKNGRHGTFADVQDVLPYVASMGFDVLYLPPIHPIGRQFRKGPNNALVAGDGDPGSPWAIGAKEGGHKEVHPALGTVEDFRQLVESARGFGLELALDIAFQASPDHPYVTQHPEWFVRRPDGTIQYAENPPKKYQDVYPFDLAGPDWEPLWRELKSVFDVWIDRGVRVFRVDNPHTKPLPFWEYCLNAIKAEHPDVLFLAEAFTRPKLMYALAKIGFSQSYTYFTWRVGSREIAAYVDELVRTEAREFFRPNFWPNIPDILSEHLQHGGRSAFVSRLVLAATASASFGIYGPSFELMEHVARPGAEEYLDSEKYQLREWDLDREASLRPIVKRLNEIRRNNPALQQNQDIAFHHSSNESVIAFSKRCAKSGNVILTVVNLEPGFRHSAWLTLDLAALGSTQGEAFQVHDLLSDARHLWPSERVYVELDPAMPAHVFRVRHRLRSEHQFEYFA
jgi:starch synthase (maltosyl-transferring)